MVLRHFLPEGRKGGMVCMTADKKEQRKEILLLLVASVLYAVSSACIAHVNIIPGSTIGISQILYKVMRLPVGTVNLLLNIPILTICVRRFGKKVLIYTAYILASSAIMINLMVPYAPAVTGYTKIILVFLGGAVNGMACGLIMRVGGSVGGSTAVVRVLKSHFQGMNVTLTMFLSDAVIYITGMAVLHDVSALFYSILYSIAASVCIDICYTFGREKVDMVDGY